MMIDGVDEDDFLVFVDDDVVFEVEVLGDFWLVLVVDDDFIIYLVIWFVLCDFCFVGCVFVFFDVYFVVEVCEVLVCDFGIVCVLFDVVMEIEFVGLDFVVYICGELGNSEICLILCIG